MNPLTAPLIALALAATAPTASAQIGVTFCPGNPNSTGAPATITATGSTDVSQNDVTLGCANLPQNSLGYFIVSPFAGGTPNPGGSEGFLCLGNSTGRYVGNVINSGATGTASMMVDLTSIPSPTGPVVAMPSDTWFFQYWHRDMALGGGATSNFSPGLSIDFDTATPTFSQDVWPMLAQSNIGAPACINCHGVNGPGGLNLGFTPAMAFAALVNTSSSSGNCGGSIYVVPGNPNASLMFDKLSNSPPACGAQMPFGGTFAGDVNVVRDWILQGAAF